LNTGDLAIALAGLALAFGGGLVLANRRWQSTVVRAARDESWGPVKRAAILSFGGLGPALIIVIGVYLTLRGLIA
jgi:hypothetical protein